MLTCCCLTLKLTDMLQFIIWPEIGSDYDTGFGANFGANGSFVRPNWLLTFVPSVAVFY